ncbi:hypothetical protein [Demequina sediminis]|nr:hypothetical protein [Demequina sediminis]
MFALGAPALIVARRFDGRARGDRRGLPLPVVGLDGGEWALHLDGIPEGGGERVEIMRYLMQSHGVSVSAAKGAAFAESFPVVIAAGASSEVVGAFAKALRELGASVSVHQG